MLYNIRWFLYAGLVYRIDWWVHAPFFKYVVGPGTQVKAVDFLSLSEIEFQLIISIVCTPVSCNEPNADTQ